MTKYIGISKPLQVVDGKYASLDAKYGPYDSINHATSSIPIAVRRVGLTVGIIFLEGTVETVKDYWWKKGIEDTDLELKIDNAASTKTSQLENDADFQSGNQVSANLQAQRSILDAVDVNLQSQINIHESQINTHSSQIQDIVTSYIDNKGYFATLTSLQASYPTPEIGDTAYVANALSSTGYYIYNVVGGIWTSSTVEAPPVAVPIADYTLNGGSPKTLKDVDDDLVQLAVDKLDKDEVVYGKNLFNVDDIVEGYKISNKTVSYGDFIADPNEVISGYIPVEFGKTYSLSFRVSSYIFYDKNKIVVPQSYRTGYTTSITVDKSDASYVVVGMYGSELLLFYNDFMVNEGGTLLPYDIYRRFVKYDRGNRGIEIRNRIVNYDFSKGTIAWRNGGHTTGFEVIDGVAKTKDTYPSNNLRAFMQHVKNISPGDKVYFAFRTKADNYENISHSLFRLGETSVDKRTLFTMTDEWQEIKGVQEWGEGTAFLIESEYNGNEIGNQIYLDYLYLINLTEIFGEGFEPNETEYELLMKEYHEGTITVPVNQFTLWEKQRHIPNQIVNDINNKENKVLLILTSSPKYDNNSFEQLIKHGFTFEATSLDLFATHIDDFINEFGTLLIDSRSCRNLNPLSVVTPNEVVTALNKWVLSNKIAYLNSSNTIECVKVDINGVVTKAPFFSLFKSTAIINTSFNHLNNSAFKIANAHLQNSTDILVEPDTQPNSTNYVLNNNSFDVIVYGYQDGVADKPFVQTDNETFIYIASGGQVSGNIGKSAGFSYVDVGYLIKMLWGNGDKAKLSYDLINKKRVVATAIDNDVTNEPDALEPYIRAWGHRPNEFGVVVEKMTPDLVDFYKVTGHNVVSHSYYHSASATTAVENHIVGSDNIVKLNKPYRVSITSAKTSDNVDVTYRLLRPGVLIFKPPMSGQEVTISYTYHDEPKEWIGSVNILSEMNSSTNRAVFLTGGSVSVHPSTYMWMRKNGVVVCDHISPIERAPSMLAYQHYFKKMVLWYGTSFNRARYGSGFDGMFTAASRQEGENLVFDCINYNKKNNQPFVWYTHDIYTAENYSVQLFGNPDGRFPSWWSAFTLEQVRQTAYEMMKFWLDAIDASSECEWMCRSDFNRRYEDIIENITYSSKKYGSKEMLLVGNRGKHIDGLTFRVKSTAEPLHVLIDGKNIDFSFSNGEVIFSFDSPAGITRVIEIEME